MIKLSTMQAVMATVTANGSAPIANSLRKLWPNDEREARFWRVSANFIFLFEYQGHEYVLRFNQATERSVEAILGELAYVRALAGKGLRVALPVRSLAGRWLETITTPLGTFHSVVFKRLEGDQLELEALSPAQFERWGRALAQLHEYARGLAVTGRSSWQDQLNAVTNIVPPDVAHVHEARAQLADQLGQLTRNDDNFGLIHFDFELDNIIWQNGQPAIIDFDDCAYSWHVADITYALDDLLGEQVNQSNLQHESVQQFLAGYRAIRQMPAAELAQISLFRQLGNLYSFARLYRALTPPDPAGELPWLPPLRAKLAAKLVALRAELATGVT